MMFSNHSRAISVVNGDEIPPFQSLNDENPQLNTGHLNYMIKFLFFLMKKTVVFSMNGDVINEHFSFVV